MEPANEWKHRLPDNIWLAILQHLPIDDLSRIRRVSRYLSQLAPLARTELNLVEVVHNLGQPSSNLDENMAKLQNVLKWLGPNLKSIAVLNSDWDLTPDTWNALTPLINQNCYDIERLEMNSYERKWRSCPIKGQILTLLQTLKTFKSNQEGVSIAELLVFENIKNLDCIIYDDDQFCSPFLKFPQIVVKMRSLTSVKSLEAKLAHKLMTYSDGTLQFPVQHLFYDGAEKLSKIPINQFSQEFPILNCLDITHFNLSVSTSADLAIALVSLKKSLRSFEMWRSSLDTPHLVSEALHECSQLRSLTLWMLHSSEDYQLLAATNNHPQLTKLSLDISESLCYAVKVLKYFPPSTILTSLTISDYYGQPDHIKQDMETICQILVQSDSLRIETMDLTCEMLTNRHVEMILMANEKTSLRTLTLRSTELSNQMFELVFNHAKNLREMWLYKTTANLDGVKYFGQARIRAAAEKRCPVNVLFPRLSLRIDHSLSFSSKSLTDIYGIMDEANIYVDCYTVSPRMTYV